MQVRDKFKGTVVTGVIGDDVHVIGIRILEHALRDAGFKVVSLGGQVSQKEFINAAVETKADAILVSSLSGHAKLFVSGFRDRCVEVGLKDVLLYLGGQLLTHDTGWQDIEKMYREMGFHRVYPSNVELSQVIADLESDLEL